MSKYEKLKNFILDDTINGDYKSSAIEDLYCSNRNRDIEVAVVVGHEDTTGFGCNYDAIICVYYDNGLKIISNLKPGKRYIFNRFAVNTFLNHMEFSDVIRNNGRVTIKEIVDLVNSYFGANLINYETYDINFNFENDYVVQILFSPRGIIKDE